jgi:ribosome-binding protein aMBF1 (putative translation factor)
MIQNEREYRITSAWLKRFERSAETLEHNPAKPGQHALARKANIDAANSQAEDLRAQLAAFDALRSHQVLGVTINGLGGLADALIQARIAAGLTQEDLAERLGLKKQQVQRYEATRYATANLERLNAVADALEVQVKTEVAFAR